MGYTVEGNVRLIGPTGKVFKPFYATLYCDPCAPSRHRYEISNYNLAHPDQIMVQPWYRVIEPGEPYRWILVKVAFAKKVLAAQERLTAAQNEYNALTF